jgi:DNA repair protein RadC
MDNMDKIDRKLFIKQICAEEMEEYRTKKAIKSAEDVHHVCITEAFMDKECVIVLTLDSANKIINKHEVSKGTVNRSIVSARDIMKECIMDSAVSFILVHNHPSGSLIPSSEDKTITSTLKQAGEILGIPMLDHVIVAKTGYFSFEEEGLF